MRVTRPTRVAAPPASLGRLGEALAWLAAAQGAWPPVPPRLPRSLDVSHGDGLAAGRAEADALADEGADLLVVESSGGPTAALVVVCALLDLEPVLAIGTGTGPGWSEQVVAVRDGLRVARQHVGDPERLVTDPVLGRLTGLLAQSAVRRTPAVLGSSVLLAGAALVAERLEPDARHWWLVGSAPTATAARLGFADLALPPLLDLGLAVTGGAQLAADLLVRGVELV